MTKILDGNKLAAEILAKLKVKVAQNPQKLKIATICFVQDPGSVLYTRKKSEKASEVGISYEVYNFSFDEPMLKLQEKIKELTDDKSVTGIMIQKPRKNMYVDHFLSLHKKLDYDFISWWRKLTETLPMQKDVDGLSSKLIAKLSNNEKVLVMPATVSAVLKSLELVDQNLINAKILIIGRSDLLGLPLYLFWKQKEYDSTLVGKNELQKLLDLPSKLKNFDVIVSATGESNLIKGDMVKEGVILIDVGEPKGDLDFESCVQKASFITPVPGGIGPLTIAELLENLVCLSKFNG